MIARQTPASGPVTPPQPKSLTHFSCVTRLTLDACAWWRHGGGALLWITLTEFMEVVNTSQAFLWVTATSLPYVAVTHVSRESLGAANPPGDVVEPSHEAKKSSRASFTLLISEFSQKHLCSKTTETVSGPIKYVLATRQAIKNYLLQYRGKIKIHSRTLLSWRSLLTVSTGMLWPDDVVGKEAHLKLLYNCLTYA